MFLPFSTDRPSPRRPIVNQLIVGANMAVFLLGLVGVYGGWLEPHAIAAWGHYDPQQMRVWQMLTYQFIHDPSSIWHLAFNMLFLWVFGNAVEGRLGRLGYFGFYLVGGCVAAIAHGMASPSPVIGASGSVAAVSGAFLALFPRAHVRVLMFIIIIGIIEIPALWFIGFYFALDVINQVMDVFGARSSNVAYAAHLAGYVYGFATAFTLLGLKILPRTEFDAFYLFRQMRRRHAFSSTTRKAPGVWDEPRADSAEELAKAKPAAPLSESQRTIMELRARLAREIDAERPREAVAVFKRLLMHEPDVVLTEKRQLEIANMLYGEGEHARAAAAYMTLLKRYPGTRETDEVRLILALLYVRHLDQPASAIELLADIDTRLTSDTQRSLASALRSELRSGA
ncbi:MAG: rhomboid family intramembrane serine protease [Phycisphaerales bacterium]